MKAITARQPRATLIAVGAKRIETRSWKTPYRGLIAIHAGKNRSAAQLAHAAQEPVQSALATAGIDRAEDLPFGAIIAVARLVNCIPFQSEADLPAEPERSFGDYRLGRYGWHLADVRVLPRPMSASAHWGSGRSTSIFDRLCWLWKEQDADQVASRCGGLRSTGPRPHRVVSDQ